MPDSTLVPAQFSIAIRNNDSNTGSATRPRETPRQNTHAKAKTWIFDVHFSEIWSGFGIILMIFEAL